VGVRLAGTPLPLLSLGLECKLCNVSWMYV
jgi:hypothetical protein